MANGDEKISSWYKITAVATSIMALAACIGAGISISQSDASKRLADNATLIAAQANELARKNTEISDNATKIAEKAYQLSYAQSIPDVKPYLETVSLTDYYNDKVVVKNFGAPISGISKVGATLFTSIKVNNKHLYISHYYYKTNPIYTKEVQDELCFIEPWDKSYYKNYTNLFDNITSIARNEKIYPEIARFALLNISYSDKVGNQYNQYYKVKEFPQSEEISSAEVNAIWDDANDFDRYIRQDDLNFGVSSHNSNAADLWNICKRYLLR